MSGTPHAFQRRNFRIGREIGQERCAICDQPASAHHLTTERTDPRLGHGSDDEPISQHDAYLVLSDEERAKGFVRPVRRTYKHLKCGSTTTMSLPLAETYARQPSFYGATYCVRCQMHRPVGSDGEFVWVDDQLGVTDLKVGE